MAAFRDVITKPSSKAIIYWVLVVAGSFIQAFSPLPQSYFSNKKNVFNVYFVKYSWGWTVSMLVVYLVGSASPARSSGRGLARLLVATFSWYFWVNLFLFIEDWTAVCEGGESFTTRSSCKAQGFYWNGFDISGHTFLLIHCCLVISEELQPLKDHKARKARVGFVVCCIIVLQFLWEFMLVCTAVYFHTVQQKTIGAAVAISNWLLTYQFWYQNKTELSPGMPGGL